MLALLLTLSLAATDPQTIISRLPEAARADAASAVALAERGDDGVLPVLRRLKENYPDEPRVFLISAMATTGMAKASPLQDVSEALDLGLSGDERNLALGLRARMYSRLGNDFLAQADAAQVLAHDKSDPVALEVALRSALAFHQPADARDYATRLTVAQPQNPIAHLYLAAVAIDEQNFELAKAELQKARAAGASGASADRIESAIRERTRSDLMLEVPLYAAAGLLLALAIIVGLGLALSSVQRRRPAPKGLLDTLHAGVLWLAIALFYLGFPLVLAFAGLVSYGFIRLAIEGLLAANFISIRMIILLVMLVIVAILSFVGVITGFFSKPSRQKLRVLGPQEAPDLFKAVAEVAQLAASRPVNRVEIGLSPNASVHEAGSTFKVLLGRGERVLGLGLTALRGMTVSQMKSVLAHEFGHFAHGETRVSPVIAGVMVRLATICANYRSFGALGKINPVYWYLAGYLWIFRRLSAGLSRRNEFQADQVAARTYGASNFTAALRAVDENGLLFGRYFLFVAVELRRGGRCFKDAVAALDAVSRGLPAEVRACLAELLAQEKPKETDTHPSTGERLKAVEGLTASRPEEPAPWTSLLPQHDALSRELTAESIKLLDEQLERQHELPATSAELAPEIEARLALALVIHLEAFEAYARDQKNGKDTSGSIARLAESIERFAATLGEKDRFLLEPLRRLARAQAATGQRDQAEATIDRAIEVAGSSPENHVVALELQSMKRSLREARGLLTPELAPVAAASAAVLSQAAGAPESAAPSTPEGEAKARCGACGSVSPVQDYKRQNSCPWCGAAWTPADAATAKVEAQP